MQDSMRVYLRISVCISMLLILYHWNIPVLVKTWSQWEVIHGFCSYVLWFWIRIGSWKYHKPIASNDVSMAQERAKSVRATRMRLKIYWIFVLVMRAGYDVFLIWLIKKVFIKARISSEWTKSKKSSHFYKVIAVKCGLINTKRDSFVPNYT